MQENFSVSDLNPLEFIKQMGKKILILMFQTFLVGLLYTIILFKCGVMDEDNVKNYFKYLLIASIITYILSIAYFAYSCQQQSMGELAKVATLGPAVVVFHIAVLVLSYLVNYIPEIGPLVYGMIWTSFGTVLITGIAYTIGFEAAKHFIKC